MKREAGRADPLDPETAEVPLTVFTVAIRPALRFVDRVFGVTIQFGACSPKAFGFLQDTLSSLPAGRGVSCTWHVSLSSERAVVFVSVGGLTPSLGDGRLFCFPKSAAPPVFSAVNRICRFVVC